MPSLRLGILATVTYAAIVAMGALFLFDAASRPSDIYAVLKGRLPAQILAVIFLLFIVFRRIGWRPTGFGEISWSGMIWFLPGWGVLAVTGWDIAHAMTPEILRAFSGISLVVLFATTLLIAFGEEVLFRGILLRGAMARLSVPVAMFLSALVFGLFHLVNGLAGQDIAGTSQQVLFAIVVGFFLAPIALRVRNLWPLIIWHWFWNIAVILGQAGGLLHPLALAGIAVQAVVSIWLWAAIIRSPRAR